MGWGSEWGQAADLEKLLEGHYEQGFNISNLREKKRFNEIKLSWVNAPSFAVLEKRVVVKTSLKCSFLVGRGWTAPIYGNSEVVKYGLKPKVLTS